MKIAIDVSQETADEMLTVGIVPFLEPPNVGELIRIGPYMVRIEGLVTKEKFLERVREVGMSVERFAVVPLMYNFCSISQPIAQ